MEQEKKLYMHVYRSILIDIFNNIYTYHNKLPTLPKLCDTYKVGRNTVRSALIELQKDGYISMQRGARAIVIFNHDNEFLHQQYIQTLAEIKHIIRGAFETIEYIFPLIGSVALMNATDEQMNMLINQVNSFDIDNIQNEAQLIKELFDIYEVGFSFINNPILDDLITTILFSIYLPSFTRYDQDSSKKSIKHIQSTLKFILKSKNRFIIKKTITGLCHSYSKQVNDYIEEICQGIPPKENKQFVWPIHRDEDYLYMKVVTGIVTDINNNIYKKGDLLPSISLIAEQYHVSERTSRRALEALREYRIIKTMNGVGSKVIINVFKNNTRLLKNAKLKNRIQSYYDASNLLSMINEVMIPKVIKSVSDEELKDIIQKIEDSEYFSLVDFYEFIYSHTNNCLYVIYKELGKYKVWGYFVNMLVEVNKKDIFVKKQALIVALKNRNIALVNKLVKEITDASMHVELN